MLTPDFFKNLSVRDAGKYNHYNDKFMANKPDTKTYKPSTYKATSMGNSKNAIPQPAPQVIIINNNKSDIWYYAKWRLVANFIDALFQRRAQPVPIPSTRKQNQNQRDQDQRNHAGLLAAVLFFAALLFGTGVAIAYGAVESKKIIENLLAGRKRMANGIKLLWSAFLGFAGTLLGVQLGAYYGTALFGALGAGISGILLGLIAMSCGILLGKYVAKGLTYIATRFKSTNSDPYSLRPSVAKTIENQFSVPHFTDLNRPNLMLGYILNKIAIAKQNNANPDWIKTLESYRQDLKNGKLSEGLKQYFDSEWAMVRNDWYVAKSIPTDPRYTNSIHKDIERDLKVLAIITSNTVTVQNDIGMLHPSSTNIPPVIPFNSPSIATPYSSPIPPPQQPPQFPSNLYPTFPIPSAPFVNDEIYPPSYFPSGGYDINNGLQGAANNSQSNVPSYPSYPTRFDM